MKVTKIKTPLPVSSERYVFMSAYDWWEYEQAAICRAEGYIAPDVAGYKWVVELKAPRSMDELFLETEDFLDEIGEKGTIRGASDCSWHTGLLFHTLTDAVQFLEKITDRFKQEIGKGLLWFELKTWDKKAWVNSTTQEKLWV